MQGTYLLVILVAITSGVAVMYGGVYGGRMGVALNSYNKGQSQGMGIEAAAVHHRHTWYFSSASPRERVGCRRPFT